MKGQVIAYDGDTGTVQGDDGKRYAFTRNDVIHRADAFAHRWQSADVDFVVQDNRATHVYANNIPDGTSPLKIAGVAVGAVIALCLVWALVSFFGGPDSQHLRNVIAADPTPPDSRTAYEIGTQGAVASFTGNINSAIDPNPFIDFIADHDGQIVYLDAWLSQSLDGSGDDQQLFTLDNKCDTSGCGGVEYLVKSQQKVDALYEDNDAMGLVHIKGYWYAKSSPGLHQGYLSTVLQGVSADADLKTLQSSSPSAQTGETCSAPDGDAYPCKLNAVISPDDWAQIRTALSFAATMPQGTVVNWANRSSGRNGTLTVVDPHGSNRCGLYKVTRKQGRMEDSTTMEWCN